jgi:hypothetical protein
MFFQPGYSKGEKYSRSHVIQSFWVKKVSQNVWETSNSGDYLVGILDREMNVTNGYFGREQYNSSYNGQSIWRMTSYPTDFNFFAGVQVTQDPMTVNSIVAEGTSSELYVMDGVVAAAGDFGAPVYAWLENHYRLIGILGVQDIYPTKFEVWAQGGPDLWNLIREALEAYP